MKKALFTLVITFLFIACSHEDAPVPFLTVTPSISSIEFSSDGKVCTSNGEIIVPSFTIATNQKTWKVASDQDWCTVSFDKSNNIFTIIAKENNSYTSSPEPAIVKISIANDTSISIRVTQKKNLHIYVAGYDVNEYFEITPTYWVDGKSVQLSKDPGTLNDILVFDNEVHAIGRVKHGNEFDATYWKNGKEITIAHEPLISTDAKSIFRYNEDIYIAVNYNFGFGDDKPKMGYWKNGELTLYTDGSNLAIASSIFIYNNDIYIAGTYNYRDAVYWKNGERIKIDTDKQINDISSIFVSNGDIYLLGYSTISLTDGIIALKNGVPFFSFNDYFYATDIFVSNNDVYILGLTSINGVRTASYWKNGERILLSDGTTTTYATSIYVKDNEVFVSGSQENTNSTIVSVYWRNGKKVDLTDGLKKAEGNSIFAVEE